MLIWETSLTFDTISLHTLFESLWFVLTLCHIYFPFPFFYCLFVSTTIIPTQKNFNLPVKPLETNKIKQNPNWNGWSNQTKPCSSSYPLLQSEPSAPPQDIKCSSPSSTNILVSWRPPPTELQNGIIVKYAVQYAATEGEDTTTRKISDIPPESSQYLLENLEKWTEYRVTVTAHTDVGEGPESLPQLIRTEEDGMFFWNHCPCFKSSPPSNL